MPAQRRQRGPCSEQHCTREARTSGKCSSCYQWLRRFLGRVAYMTPAEFFDYLSRLKRTGARAETVYGLRPSRIRARMPEARR